MAAYPRVGGTGKIPQQPAIKDAMQQFMPQRRFQGLITLSLVVFLLVISGNWVTTLAQEFVPLRHAVFYVAPDGDDANTGSLDQPWATLNHAAEMLQAGETVYLRAGNYPLTQQVSAQSSGTRKAWITYSAFPGEHVILDADAIRVAPPSGDPPFHHDEGAVQLENVDYIQFKNLEVINSHNSGITVRNSNHIRLVHNKTENTFSPGIGVWGGTHQQILGNIVINANDPKMADFPNDWTETAHEAISVGGTAIFEVAYNLVKDGQKEGIDIKDNSRHGVVHHNYIHHMARQALYVDGWEGVLEDIEVTHNVAHDCQGAGFALSVEGESSLAKNVRVHHNLLYNNWGTGILFARWGDDGPRQDIKIYNNTVHHNGHGKPNPGEEFYWITGGLYLFSDDLESVEIHHNILSDNRGFQMGYSDRYLAQTPDIATVLQQKKIAISHNLISGPNDPVDPIYAGWPPDSYANIYGVNGASVLTKEPPFMDPAQGNFYLSSQPEHTGTGLPPNESQNEPQLDIGAFPLDGAPNLWWQTDFPPKDFPPKDFPASTMTQNTNQQAQQPLNRKYPV